MKTTIDGHQWCGDGRSFLLHARRLSLSLPPPLYKRSQTSSSLSPSPVQTFPHLFLTRSCLLATNRGASSELVPRRPNASPEPRPSPVTPTSRPPVPCSLATTVSPFPARQSPLRLSKKLQGRRRQFCDLVPSLVNLINFEIFQFRNYRKESPMYTCSHNQTRNNILDMCMIL
jgi:hypothetical protein